MSKPPLFHIELPKMIVLQEVTLDLWVKNGNGFEGITAEILDEGGGSYLKLTTESATLDPEELDALTKTLLAVCKFIDEHKFRPEEENGSV